MFGLAGLSGEIVKYQNLFQIMFKVTIPKKHLHRLRQESDFCLTYHFKFKLYLPKMSSESAASYSFLVINASMSHRYILFGS